MASAYSTIANYGEKVDSYLIESIKDADGNVIYQHEPNTTRVLDEALIAAVVRTLRKVPRPGGTAPAANIGRDQFGKTGTAQNFRDVWFVGAVPQYTTAVWVGYPDAQVEMVNFGVYDERTDKVQPIARAYGGTVAAPVWNDFMSYVPGSPRGGIPAGPGRYRRLLRGAEDRGARCERDQRGRRKDRDLACRATPNDREDRIGRARGHVPRSEPGSGLPGDPGRRSHGPLLVGDSSGAGRPFRIVAN